jgi:hypothetical protein
VDYRIAVAVSLTFLTPLTFSSAAAADPPDQSGPALTIYNENFAVVRDTIPLDLKSGENHVSYTGITAQVEPDSVILRDPAGVRTLSILEQNYRGDTISQALLLSLNEGKTIDFQTGGRDGSSPRIVQGKIIRSGYDPTHANYTPFGYDPAQSDNAPLIEVDGKLQFGLPGLPLFPKMSDDSILTPTLEWTIETDEAGPLTAELAYVTEGITWDASYNIVAPQTGDNVDLTAWVTMENKSGKEFDNARIKLMAGDLNKIAPGAVAGADRVSIVEMSAAAMPRPTLATQQDFDEYHLYTLPNTTSLRNRETKQVEFLQAHNIISKEVFVYDGLKLDSNPYDNWNFDNIRNTRDYGTDCNTKVDIERDFVNTTKNGLGVPLPAGKVRFYRRDSDGQLEFIGENKIDHTPQDETVKVITGNAFDLVGSRTQTEYSVNTDRGLADESFSIVVTNHKKTPVAVTVVEHLYRAAQWTITKNSDPYFKKDSSTINFPISIPARGSKTITYTAHYNW